MGRAHNGELSYLAQPALPWENIVNATGGLLEFPSATLLYKTSKQTFWLRSVKCEP